MGKKADALRIVNAQTGENYTITRETVGFDDGTLPGLEVTLRHADHPASPIVVELPDTVDEAHRQMISLAGVAARRLLEHPQR